METSNYSVPEGKPSASRAGPPPVRGTGRLSAVAERGDSHWDAPPANPTLHMGKHCPAQRLLAKASTRAPLRTCTAQGFPRRSKAGSGL